MPLSDRNPEKDQMEGMGNAFSDFFWGVYYLLVACNAT
jgi:hypothetical protein